jgi:hypothetical protein
VRLCDPRRPDHRIGFYMDKAARWVRGSGGMAHGAPAVVGGWEEGDRAATIQHGVVERDVCAFGDGHTHVEEHSGARGRLSRLRSYDAISAQLEERGALDEWAAGICRRWRQHSSLPLPRVIGRCPLMAP